MRISDWSSDVCSSDLLDGPDVATEFLGTSITSGGNGAPKAPGDERRLANNPHVALLNHQRGYQTFDRSEEHTSELQSLMRISYAVFCLKKKKHTNQHTNQHRHTQQQQVKNIETTE